MKLNLVYIVVIYIVISCNKNKVEPIGFKQVNYITSKNENQTFEFYYDDGVKVANALDIPMVTINTKANSFTEEHLLTLNFRKEIPSVPDSILPFTYFFNTNYAEKLNNEVEFRISYEYPYANTAHKNIEEEKFFLDRLNDLKLIKIETTQIQYYDPEIKLKEIPFSINTDTKEIVFSTNDINSYYGFCWIETEWNDSVSFIINDDSLSNTYIFTEKGIKTRNSEIFEGSFFQFDRLNMQYLDAEENLKVDSNYFGWKIDEIYVEILSPTESIINHADINCDILVYRLVEYKRQYTHLRVITNTLIQVLKWPDFGEKGILEFSGEMYLEASNKNVPVLLNISFQRQR